MKILIADDDMTSRLILGATLQRLGHEATAVENGQRAWEAWQSGEFTLLISDWMMPDIDGLELCRRIRAEHCLQYTYIILLTAQGGKSSFLDGMDAGADDFITKPFDEESLAARLRVAERILDLHETLRVQAMHDRLTGLWNRAAIMDHLQHELDRASRDNTPVGVILADLDHFKAVNDTYGHLAGDAVLQEAALRMRASLRSYDKLGRYGGEEFLIVVPGCTLPNLVALAERIRVRVSAEAVKTSGETLPITGSFGVACSCIGVREKADKLIAAADVALYRAKNAGRNCVEGRDSE